MSNKLQTALHKIKPSVDLDELSGQITAEYSEQNLRTDKKEIDGFTLKLFYKKNFTTPSWKNFLQNLSEGDQDAVQYRASASEAFILLLTKGDNIYALSGGAGYFALQSFIDTEFGVDVFSRLVKKEDKILKATKEVSLVGGVLGTSKHFRKTYNFFDNEAFGRIYQELNAALDKEVMKSEFDFPDEELKKDSICVAKSSLKFNKKFSIEQFIKIITGCEKIINERQPIIINDVVKLSAKSDKILISDLEEELLNHLFKRYQDPENSAIDFDLCHNDFEKYLTGTRYIARKPNQKSLYLDIDEGKLDNIDDLFESIRSNPKAPNDLESFNKLVRNLNIDSYDADDNLQTSGRLLDHILGDILLEPAQRRYFLIDRKWYWVKDTFLEKLESECQNLIKTKPYTKIDKVWEVDETENQYNSKYIESPNAIVLDKILAENIELCDILQWDEEHVYLCHVKKGFDNSMRELCSQINIAAQRLKIDLSGNKSFLKSVYSSLTAKIGGNEYFDNVGKQTVQYSEDKFLELFEQKTPVFVLSVLDTSDRPLQNIKDFNSTIAKYSLQTLALEMKSKDTEHKISQINAPTIVNQVVAA